MNLEFWTGEDVLTSLHCQPDTLKSRWEGGVSTERLVSSDQPVAMSVGNGLDCQLM